MDYLYKLANPDGKHIRILEDSLFNGYEDNIFKYNQKELNIQTKEESIINDDIRCNFCKRKESNETIVIKCSVPLCNEAYCQECYEQTNEVSK